MKNLQTKLQMFAGAMMVPVILLVLVGFFVGIGAAFTNYLLPTGSLLHKLFSMVSNLGFLFMNNLPLWFAVAVSFTLAKKEKGWAAFAGLVTFYCYIKGIQGWAAMMGITAETVAVEALIANGYSEQAALNFNALWGSNLGMFSYNMGIFSGLISGLVTALIHNRFVDKTLPDMFAFFQGTKYVVILCTLVSIPLAIATYHIWPLIGKGLQSLTNLMTSSGLFGTWLFGTVDKALLPFGVHHLIAFPIEYSRVGGTMEIDGVIYEGVRNIINGQAASASATGYITRNFTNGRLLFQLAGIPGAAYAMYRCAKEENRPALRALFIPAVFTLAMVGISEPFEYTFLFAAPALYWLIYAPLCGFCYVLAEVFRISINGTALLFMIPNIFQPHKVHAIHALWLLPLTFFLFYIVFRFIIIRFDLPTPGRGESKVHLYSKKEYTHSNADLKTDFSLEEKIIEALGTSENIESVTCCATRLRVIVKDDKLIASDDHFKEECEAIDVVHGKNSVQIIYGVRVQSITTKIKDILHMD